jgi:(2Fe-2S) ferredoxin
MTGSDRSPQKILVCQNRTCRKQGSAEVLAAFRESCKDGGTGDGGTGVSPVLRVEGSGCLGHCGSGPMVLLLPEEVWYCRFRVEDVLGVQKRHLIDS